MEGVSGTEGVVGVGRGPQDRCSCGGAKLLIMESTPPMDPYRRLQDMVREAPQLMAALVAARQLGLAHVYLGYWIADSSKMAYKRSFRPLEFFGPEGWTELPSS